MACLGASRSEEGEDLLGPFKSTLDLIVYTGLSKAFNPKNQTSCKYKCPVTTCVSMNRCNRRLYA